MKKLIVFAAIAVTTPAAGAAAGETPPPPPPEVARTVAAFVGRTVYDSTITMPGGQPQKTRFVFDCNKTALGKAVTCRFSGDVPGAGPMEGSFLIGYDTHGKAVHFMAMTSDEEVHDHRCNWKGNDLVCDLLKGGMGGQAITEDLSFSFAGKSRSFRSTITLADGGKVYFEGTARR
jgi:hypothetical protein